MTKNYIPNAKADVEIIDKNYKEVLASVPVTISHSRITLELDIDFDTDERAKAVKMLLDNPISLITPPNGLDITIHLYDEDMERYKADGGTNWPR